MTDRLTPKPCPFCGGNNTKIYAHWAWTWLFLCVCLRCKAQGPISESKEAAITEWNKRAE